MDKDYGRLEIRLADLLKEKGLNKFKHMFLILLIVYFFRIIKLL